MADGDSKKIPVTSIAPPASTGTASDASKQADNPFDPIRDEMQARYELLPEDVQKVIVDEDYTAKLFAIAKEQKLTYEELGTLETETTMVLLGMVKPDEYRDELQLQLKKNDAEIEPVVKAVSEQVFAPLRASLEKIYRGRQEPEDYIPDSLDAGIIPPAASPAPAAATAKPAPVWKPAAAPIAAPAPSLSTAERGVLEKTGVVISETPVQAPAAPMRMPERSELLKGIENPPKAASASLVADKLGSTSAAMPTKVTDYSMPKATAPLSVPPVTPAPPGIDPYREKI